MTHQTFFSPSVMTIDGEEIKARISWNQSQREWLIEVLANGMALVDESERCTTAGYATIRGYDMVIAYVQKVFRASLKQPSAPAASASPIIEDAPMSDMPDDESDYPPLITKYDRIEQLRREIEQSERAIQRARREIEDLLGE